MTLLRKHRFKIILLALVCLLLSPLIASVTQVGIATVVWINLTLVSVASFIVSFRKIPRLLISIISIVSIILVWAEYIYPEQEMLPVIRMICLLALYGMLAFILIRNFIDAKVIDLHVILGAMAGFIVLGYIGGSLFEIMEHFHPQSIEFLSHSGGYDLYYYSFVSMMTIGYGDIIPLTPPAKSLTILLSLIGQFYMTIGIALFVGKYLYSLTSKE